MPRNKHQGTHLSSTANKQSSPEKKRTVAPPKKRYRYSSVSQNAAFDEAIIAACKKVKYATKTATAHYQKLKVDDKGEKTKQLANVLLIYPPQELSDEEKVKYGHDIINYIKGCIKFHQKSLHNILLKPHDKEELALFNNKKNQYIVNDKLIAEIIIPLDAPPGTIAFCGPSQYHVISFFTKKLSYLANDDAAKAAAKPAAASSSVQPSLSSHDKDNSESEDGEYDDQECSFGSASDDRLDDSESEQDSSADSSSEVLTDDNEPKHKRDIAIKLKKPSPPLATSTTSCLERHPRMKGATSENKGEPSMRVLTEEELRSPETKAAAKPAVQLPQADKTAKPLAPATDRTYKESGVEIPSFRKKGTNYSIVQRVHDKRPEAPHSFAETAIPSSEISIPKPQTSTISESVIDLRTGVASGFSRKRTLEMEYTQPATLTSEADTSKRIAVPTMTCADTPIARSQIDSLSHTVEETQLVVAVTKRKPESDDTGAQPAAPSNATDISKDTSIHATPSSETSFVQMTASTVPPSQSKNSSNDTSKPNDAPMLSTAKVLQSLMGTAANPYTFSDDEKEMQQDEAEISRLEQLKAENDKKLAELAIAKKLEEDRYLEFRNKKRAANAVRIAQLKADVADSQKQIGETEVVISTYQKRTSLGSGN